MIKNILIKYKLYIGFGLLMVGIISFFTFHTNDKDIPVVVDAKEIQTNSENDLETYYIDVKGAVKNPGVYKVVKGSIINDVIEIAGGLKSNAYTSNINLSKKVSDEMVIYVYTKSEFNKLNTNSGTKSSSNNNSSIQSNSSDISSCIKQGISNITLDDSNSNGSIDDNSTDELNQNKLINLNTATKEELMSLNGIGESKALCIIEYRNQNSGFKSIEEIMNISGIGEASFAKIKDFITV